MISAKNEATGISVTVKTTGSGDYTFSNLDPGVYTVTASAKGFQMLTQKNIHVNAMETDTYSPTLTVGVASVEVTVTAEPPQLETSNATLGATMENETYAELPIEMGAYGSADQRRATDFVYLMPGVQGNETNGNATTNTGVVNGSGSKGAVSAVYIDGLPFVRAGGNGDPRYVWTAISVDAIDQFQLQTTGYSAVYEGQGVMNYSIKQGGAKYHGAVYEFFRNTALDTWGWFKANDPVTGLPVKPVEHSNEYGINVSGPLHSLWELEKQGLLLWQLQRLPLFERNADTDDLPDSGPTGGRLQQGSGHQQHDDTHLRSSFAGHLHRAQQQRILPVPVRLRCASARNCKSVPMAIPTAIGPINVIPSAEFSPIVEGNASIPAHERHQHCSAEQLRGAKSHRACELVDDAPH